MNTNPPRNGEFGQRPVPPSLRTPKTAKEALRPEAGTPPPPAVVRRSRRSRSQFVVFMNFVMSAVILLVLGTGGTLGPAGSTRHSFR